MKLLSKSWKENLLFCLILACFLVVPELCRPWLERLDMYSSLVVSQLLVQIPIALYFIVTRQNPIRLMGFHKIKLLCIPLLVLMTYCLIPLTMVLNLISQMFAGSGTAELTMGLTGGFWKNLLFVAVMPAVSEEIACRGTFFGTFRKHSLWGSILMSALFFGLLHMNWNQFSYAFVIGAVFAMTIVATGSIWSGMIMHFVFNAHSVIMLEVVDYLMSFMELEEDMAATEPLTADTVLTALFVMLPYALLCLFAGILLYLFIARLMGREQEVKALFCRKATVGAVLEEEASKAARETVEASQEAKNVTAEVSAENIELPQTEKRQNFIDLFWILAVAGAVLVMTFL